MARDRNRLCIEDPFEISYNVARTVTKDGLYTVSGLTSSISVPLSPCRSEASLCVPRVSSRSDPIERSSLSPSCVENGKMSFTEPPDHPPRPLDPCLLAQPPLLRLCTAATGAAIPKPPTTVWDPKSTMAAAGVRAMATLANFPRKSYGCLAKGRVSAVWAPLACKASSRRVRLLPRARIVDATPKHAASMALLLDTEARAAPCRLMTMGRDPVPSRRHCRLTGCTRNWKWARVHNCPSPTGQRR